MIERHERHLRQFPVATISKFYCQFVAPSTVFIERTQLSNFETREDARKLKALAIFLAAFIPEIIFRVAIRNVIEANLDAGRYIIF